jgi:hypothetical protein
MKRRIFCCALCAATLTGCGGIPLRSLPRLVQLSDTLLEANPAEFRVALQIDERIAPPASVVPKLIVQIKPRVAGAFEPVDKKLPLQLSTENTAGLDPAPAGRRWLVYSMPPATQVELVRIQEAFRRAKALPDDKKGGSLSLGIEQTDLAITNPALADTRWNTWLQVQQNQGYFEVWSGTPSQLLALAQKKKYR